VTFTPCEVQRPCSRTFCSCRPSSKVHLMWVNMQQTVTLLENEF